MIDAQPQNFTYDGMIVVVDDKLERYIEIPRSWRARLFCKPWRPWQRMFKIPMAPTFHVDHEKGIIYTTRRGRDQLKKLVKEGGTYDFQEKEK